jgi:hypothetical protein
MVRQKNLLSLGHMHILYACLFTLHTDTFILFYIFFKLSYILWFSYCVERV